MSLLNVTGKPSHGQALLLDSDVFKKFLRSDQHEATIMGPDERFTWYLGYGKSEKYFCFKDIIVGVKTKHSCLL